MGYATKKGGKKGPYKGRFCYIVPPPLRSSQTPLIALGFRLSW